MDSADNHNSLDSRLNIDHLQRKSPTSTQVHDEMKPETKAHQKDSLTQEPKNSADQKHGANQIETLKDKSVGVAANSEEKRNSGAESSKSKKEQLMVKLKYRIKTMTTFLSGDESPTDASSLGSSWFEKPSGIFNPSSGTIVVDQEIGEHPNTSSQNSKPTDPQTKIEKSGHYGALALNPLNEPTEELIQANIIKDEPDHDVHEQVDHPSQGLAKDEMDVDAHLAEDTIHVPVKDNLFSKPEKLQESVAVKERRVDDVDGDYQQSEHASPETASGGHAAFDDGYISDEIDPNKWFPNAMNQYEADIGEAIQSQQGQNHRASDHQVTSSGFTDKEMNVRQQEKVNRLPQTFNIGQSDPEVQDIWSQPHPDFSDPVHFTNRSSSPHYRNSPLSSPAVALKEFAQYQTPPPHHVSQQPFNECNQPNFGSGFYRRQQLQAQVEDKKKQLENFNKLYKERQRQNQQVPYEFSYPQSQLDAPSPFLKGPLTYQRAPQFSNPHLSNGLNSTDFRQLSLPTIPYGQMPPNMSYGFNPASLYKRTTKAPEPSSSDNRMPGPYVSLGLQEARKKVLDENDCGDECDASDDDEPLRSRVKRHPSVTSNRDSIISISPPLMTSNCVLRHAQQNDDSEVEFVTSKTKPNHTAARAVQKQVGKPLTQPGSSSPPANNASPSSGNAGEIDWSLPQYEIQRQPLAKGEEIPSAKVSLPGLVREELLLSPDHADEEVHLLMNIFIPNQRALPSPDPEPAIALLNFHTIAVMVIEAYVQYEIGDELGTGRGHFHTLHDQGAAEYERTRDAVDADTNEIFFAVIDRYRAGLESKKKPLQLIRGTQEFCDVALDVIYYIKEHGLLRPEPKTRAARVDKGVKRGPRGGAKAGEAKSKESKRGTTAKPNEVQPRKRAKTAAAMEVKKKRAKPKTLGVTVVRR